MRRLTLRLFLGSAAVGAALTLGCAHECRSCKTCGTVAYVTPYRAPTATPFALAPTPAPLSEPTVTALKPADPEPAAEPAPESKAVWQKIPWSGDRERLGRRTFTDLTADPAYAHAPDYGWLVGALDYVQGENVWRLHYASAEDDDRYDGDVTLIDAPAMTGFHSGQIVRVEGRLLNPESQEFEPAYHVESLKPLERP